MSLARLAYVSYICMPYVCMYVCISISIYDMMCILYIYALICFLFIYSYSLFTCFNVCTHTHQHYLYLPMHLSLKRILGSRPSSPRATGMPRWASKQRLLPNNHVDWKGFWGFLGLRALGFRLRVGFGTFMMLVSLLVTTPHSSPGTASESRLLCSL